MKSAAPNGRAAEAETNMTEAIENMLQRRSVRRFTQEQISDEALDTILRCGLYAPSGGNAQSSRFIVIQSPETLARLNSIYIEEFASREIIEGQQMNVAIKAAQNPNCNFLYNAPTLITAVAPKEHSNSMANCAVALENILLAASALGLGGCWGNQGKWLTDVPAVRELFEELGMREDENIFGSVSIGHPQYISTKERPRKEGRIVLDIARELARHEQT